MLVVRRIGRFRALAAHLTSRPAPHGSFGGTKLGGVLARTDLLLDPRKTQVRISNKEGDSMKSRAIHVLATLAILLGPMSSAGSALAAPGDVDPVPFDVGPGIRGWEATTDHIDLSAEALDEVAAEPTLSSTPLTDCTLDTKIFLILNDVLASYQLAYFNLVAESSMTQVWVQANLAWPAGGPRVTPA